MAGKRICLLFVVVIVCILSGIGTLELDSFLLDAMDDTMLTMESERSSLDFTKEIEVSTSVEKPMVTTYDGTSSRRRVEFGKRRRPSSGRELLPIEYERDGGIKLMSFSVKSTSSRDTKFEKELSIPSFGFRPVFKTKAKKVKKKKVLKVPRNKNLRAMNQILSGMMEADAMGRGIRLSTIQRQVIDACNANQYVLALKLVGHNIYNARKAKGRRRRRAIMSTKRLLSIIKSKIGQEKYQQLMAEDGEVTLAFALDTTGSMADDIDSAKKIVIGIVNSHGGQSIDYILSPFNDPISHALHGPVTYMDKSQKDEFVSLVKHVNVEDGGDCDEMAIDGTYEIYGNGIKMGSPIYVLTDAGAKDATDENLDALKEMALSFETPINFFLSNVGCLKEDDIKVYKSLAKYSGGQILYFSNKKQIASTIELIQKGLIGGTNIPVIPGVVVNQGRKKRSILAAAEYSMLVDDSIDVLSMTIMDRSNVDAQLYNPAGLLEVKGKIDTGKGAIFLVEKPVPGVWKIKCLSCSSGSYIVTNGISLENIDFEYNFLVAVKTGRKSKVISSSYPIKGKESEVIITIPAHAKTEPSTYKLQIINDAMKTLHVASLKQHGRAPGRYKGTFPTPTTDFRLVLEGKTKKNKAFKRLANGIIKPKYTIIHVFSTPRGFSVRAGSRSSTIVIFALHCYKGREMYDVKVTEMKKFAVRSPRRLNCIQNRMSLFPVSFRAPSSAKKGNTHNAVVTVISKRSGIKAAKHIQLLIV